jgi:hypothetical protein
MHHSGIGIVRKDALSLNQIAQTILDVLLNIHAYSSTVNYLSYNDWLKNIDTYIESAYRGVQIKKEQLVSIGIIQDHTLQ